MLHNTAHNGWRSTPSTASDRVSNMRKSSQVFMVKNRRRARSIFSVHNSLIESSANGDTSMVCPVFSTSREYEALILVQ